MENNTPQDIFSTYPIGNTRMSQVPAPAYQTNNFDTNSVLCTILEELRQLDEKFEKGDAENKKKLQHLTDEITAIRAEVKQLRDPAMQEIDTTLLPNLPLVSLEEFKEFDMMLLAEDEMRAQVKLIIQRAGGKDFPSFLRRAIKTIISDELGVNLTWRGTQDKPSIQLFTIYKLIKDICHSMYSHATDVDINRVCQQHFVHASDRVAKKRKSESIQVGESIKKEHKVS